MFTRDELDRLLKNQRSVNLSIFLATGVKEGNAQKGKIRFKNLIKQGADLLEKEGIKKTELKKYIEPMEKLVDYTKFWNTLDRGFAVFANDQDLYHYNMPVEFEDTVVVKNDFYIKPLFPIFQRNGQYYILAMSQNQVRLLHCTRDEVKEVELKGVPKNFVEALNYDEPQPQLQHGSRNSDGSAVFHGHGYGGEDEKVDIAKYFQEVSQKLYKELKNKEIPMVLAAVDYLHPIFHDSNKYPHLLKEGINGNPDNKKDEELLKEGWRIIKPLLEKEEEEALDKYHQLIGSGKASHNIEEIVNSAYNKRIEALMIKEGTQLWGSYQPTDQKVEIGDGKNGEEELLNFASIHTFINGGKVYILEEEKMPKHHDVAAIFRF